MDELEKMTNVEEAAAAVEETADAVEEDPFVHEEGEIHLEGPMRFSDQFAFRLRYSYFGLNGLAYWILSVLIIGLLIGNWSGYQQSTRVLLIAILAIMVIYLPGNTALRTLQFTTQLKADGITFEYYINRYGIQVIQGELKNSVSWEQIRKVKETRKRFFVYVMKNSAFVFGKDLLGEQCGKFREYASAKQEK